MYSSTKPERSDLYWSPVMKIIKEIKMGKMFCCRQFAIEESHVSTTIFLVDLT